MNRSNRLSKNLTEIFGSRGIDECRVCKNPLSKPRRKYCCDRCQRIAYAVIGLYRWSVIKAYVKDRDGHACVNPACPATAAEDGVTLHVDHVRPLVDAGPAHDPANLQTLCDECNQSKGTAHTDYRPEPLADGGYPQPGSPEADVRAALDAERDPETPTPSTPIPMTSADETTAGTETESPDLLHDDVELLPTGDILPYGNNPKEHPDWQIDRLASAIRQYGWDQPVVVDENHELIKGHGRLQAAKKLGLDHVPAIVRDDLTDAEKRGSRLADNKLAETDWDGELLAQEFLELEDTAPEFDLTDTGFDDDEIDEYMELIQPPEPVADDDDPAGDESVLKVVIPVEDDTTAEEIGTWAEEQGHEWHVVED